jgi:hypothetical protein
MCLKAAHFSFKMRKGGIFPFLNIASISPFEKLLLKTVFHHCACSFSKNYCAAIALFCNSEEKYAALSVF